MIWIFVIVGLVILAIKSNVASAGIPIVGSFGRLVGFDWSRLSNSDASEEQQILQASANAGIDPRFISAIRQAENGGPGREYGILGINANSLSAQLSAAIATVKHFLSAYATDTGLDPVGSDGRYTPDFITYVGNGGPSHGGWAPVGASNDPSNLNANWIPNVMTYYYSTEVMQA